MAGRQGSGGGPKAPTAPATPSSMVGASAMIEGGPASTAMQEYEEETGSIVTSGRQYTDKPEFGGDEVAMPRLRLAQGTTPEVQAGEAKPGQWVLGGHEPFDTVTFIPTMFARARELRDPKDNKQILCASADFKVGHGNPGGVCFSCPMNQWGPPSVPGGKGTPPACARVYSYVGWSIEHQQLVAVEFKKTGMQAAKFINSLIQAKGLSTFAIELAHTSSTGQRGIFHVPSANLAAADEDEFAKAGGAHIEPTGSDDYIEQEPDPEA